MFSTILSFITNKSNWKWVASNWKLVLIGILVVIILLQRCGGKNNVTPKIVTDSFTTIKIVQIPIHDTISVPYAVVQKEIHDSVAPKGYIPSKNYDSLKLQYTALVDSIFTHNIYNRTFKVDTIGTVSLDDTTYGNHLGYATFKTNLHYPKIIVNKTINTTITVPEAAKNQVYIGGGLIGNNTDILSGVDGGIIFKNKKDQIFQGQIIFTGANIPVLYSLSTYWKIKL